MIALDMLRSTRRKIFYILVAIFLALGTGIVSYANGWRLDIGRWRVEKVGEIYVRSFPDDATVSINGKPARNQTSFISRGTLIDNLLPRTYTLALAKPGFAPWHENIAVAPSLVAELKFAVLVPQNATTVFMGPLTQAFPTKFGIVTQAADNTIRLNGTPLATGILVARDNQSIAASLPEILVRSSRDRSYYGEDLDAGKRYNLSALFAAHGVDLMTASSVVRDGYASLLVAMNFSTVTIFDETAGSVAASVHASSGVAFATPPVAAPSGIAWSGYMGTRDTSMLYRYDPASGSVTQSSSTLTGQTAQLAWIAGSNFAVLQNTGELYRYDADTQTFTDLASDVLAVSISGDGAMLAARERKSIEVFALDGADYWRLNPPDLETIQNLIWYRDDRHLFVAYPNHISFLDLADASLANVATIGTGILPRYDPGANALYMLDNERNFIRFDFPE
jgi:hypothetical protein